MTFLSKLFSFLKSPKPHLSSEQKVAIAASLSVPTQAIHHHQSRLRLATLNGLLVADGMEDTRDRFVQQMAKVDAVIRAKGSA